MSLLPLTGDPDRYFADVHGQPLEAWRGALTALAARHGFCDGPWERAVLGRNVVFLGPSVTIKLGRPCWRGVIAREADALQPVAHRLPCGASCRNWPAVARCLWQLDMPERTARRSARLPLKAGKRW